MRITCPNCNASYEVPDAMLVVGRDVRCARCLREWAPLPAPAPPADTAPHEPDTFESGAFEVDGFALPPPERPRFTDEDFERTPVSQTPVSRPPDEAHAWRDVLLPRNETRPAAPARRAEGWVGWLASLVLLVVLAGAAVAWRGPVQRAWPPSARVYGALGLRQARPEALPLDSAKGSPLETPPK